ncbi:MAG: DUF58 domain-containing protein [Flavobacteriales bacterium]
MPLLKPVEYERFTSLEFLARQVVEGFITGMHKSPYHGFSVEFAEHRLYNTGESTRHIDWKLYARTDKLFTKRFEEETNLRCRIVIDVSPSMFYPVEKISEGLNKLAFSIHSAAALTELLKRQRDAVGIALFSDKVYLNTQIKSSFSHHKMLYYELEKAYHQYTPGATGSTHISEALHEIAENTHKRSLIVLFTDMFDSGHRLNEIFSALQHLRYKKHEVIIFHVVDKEHEINLEFENRPYTFVDMETAEEVKLNPTQIKDEYQRLVSAQKKEVADKCGQYRIDLVDCDIREGYNKVLTQYLVKREKMY